jgi:hypothetical protein
VALLAPAGDESDDESVSPRDQETRLLTKYSDPEIFTGDPDQLNSFLAQLKIKFLINRD